MNKSNFEVLAFTPPPEFVNPLYDCVLAVFRFWDNFKGINLHPSFCHGNFYHKNSVMRDSHHVILNDHIMVNPTHVTLNSFQGLRHTLSIQIAISHRLCCGMTPTHVTIKPPHVMVNPLHVILNLFQDLISWHWFSIFIVRKTLK